jgi:hypothetical protein
MMYKVSAMYLIINTFLNIKCKHLEDLTCAKFN